MSRKELFTKEARKALIDRFPYLQPRNFFTDKVPEDFDFQYIRGEYEIPDGWLPLFLQACEDIYEPLKRDNCLDKFRFSQIKEKYGSMRIYTFGAPQEVHNILGKYEFLSQQVCCRCGKSAAAMTRGWICPYCSVHLEEELGKHLSESDPIKIETSFVLSSRSAGNTTETVIDCSDEWTRYLERVSKNDKRAI